MHTPVPSFLGRGDSAGPCSPSGEAKKFPQTVSSIHGSVAPIFQKLTIEVSVKQPPPPPLLQRLAGSGNPSALWKTKGAGGHRATAPASCPRKGWRGHGCKVLGFFSLLDMNKGIRTASFRSSLRRTKGPAVRAAQPLIKRQSPVTQHHPRYLCS